MSTIDHTDLPLGLGMSLAQNVDAMEYFSSLDDETKQSVLAHTHAITSKSEMQQYVASLGRHELS